MMRILKTVAMACVLIGGGVGVTNAQSAPLPSLTPPPAPAPQNWVVKGTAHLRALNKVDAHAVDVTMHVGQTIQFGTLSITLRSCLTRPADEAPDSAAFLSVTDSIPGAQPFNSWMLAKEPSVSMLEHPVYGLLLTDCE